MYSSHTPFPKFLHLPSINKTCSAGDINSMNLLVKLRFLVQKFHNKHHLINHNCFYEIHVPIQHRYRGIWQASLWFCYGSCCLSLLHLSNCIISVQDLDENTFGADKITGPAKNINSDAGYLTKCHCISTFSFSSQEEKRV